MSRARLFPPAPVNIQACLKISITKRSVDIGDAARNKQHLEPQCFGLKPGGTSNKNMKCPLSSCQTNLDITIQADHLQVNCWALNKFNYCLSANEILL